MMATVIERAGDQLGDFLPRFCGALLLLIVGLILAAVLGRLVRSALIRSASTGSWSVGEYPRRSRGPGWADRRPA